MLKMLQVSLYAVKTAQNQILGLKYFISCI